MRKVAVRRKTPFFKQRLSSIEVKDTTISRLLEDMSRTGFQGRRLGEVLTTWAEMLREEDLTIYLGYTGSMSTTGQWKIIKWLIERRYIDVLVSTGANISEDILEAAGGTYWQGSPIVDDHKLLRYKISRFYDVYCDEYEYRNLESLIADFMREVGGDRVYSSAEFLYLFGKWLSEGGIDSILASAYRAGVPVFSPALVDSGYGIAYLLNKRHYPGFKLFIDQFRDFEQMVAIKERAKESAVIYIGGGVPKDLTQLVTVARSLLPDRKYERAYPHRYAIQITTDSPQWGGLSGCTFEEAISWGKESKLGRNVQCYCDATIALPIVANALNELGIKRRRHPDFSWLFNPLKEEALAVKNR